MGLLAKKRILVDTIKNLNAGSKFDVTFVTEAADWAVLRIVECVSGPLNALHLAKARITTTHHGIQTKLAHFGSIHMLVSDTAVKRINPKTKAVVTWFHIFPNDPKLKLLRESQHTVARIHTACQQSRSQMLEAGIMPEKISVIPLGVNPAVFRPATHKERLELRQKLGIPMDLFVIGSFQKDGEGWGEGNKPKLIKGPDIFVETLKKLKKNLPVHALLAGPARGYVKRGLTEAGVPFTDVGNVEYGEFGRGLAQYYGALDAYLIGSRLEGGPMQFLESWASNIPLVSTRVGMVKDLAVDKQNILFADIEDVDALVKNLERIAADPALRNSLTANALTESKNHTWESVARNYYNELYQPLLNDPKSR